MTSGLDQSDAVALTVLKKSMDIQKQTAMQLIEALPPVQSQPTGNLGRNIDVHA
ncbi:MAG: YjfB family protein [Saprospiraceae bacterium]